MRSGGTRRAVLAALAMTVALVTGCGDDGGAAEPGAEDEADEAATMTETTAPPPAGEVDLAAVIVEQTLPGFEVERPLADPVGLAGAAEHDPYDDGPQVLREAGFRQALYRNFVDADDTSSVDMALLEFAADEGARAYARRLVDAFVALGAPDATEVEVPGMPDALGVSVADSGAVVLAIRNGVLVQVGLGSDQPGPDFLALATEVLQAQLERL